MNFLRKKDDLCYSLASMQARIFEKSVDDNIPSYFFIQQYMLSNYTSLLDNLSYFESGLSELELYLNIKNTVKRNRGKVYPKEIMHWIGFFYRYASYLSGIDSKTLFKKINPNKLCEAYPLYHSLDIQKAVETILDDIDLENMTPMDRFKNLYKSEKIVL